MALGTFILSATSKTIVASMGVSVCSLNVTSGTVTILGTGGFPTWTNTAITLAVGQPVTLPSITNIQPLDGITIDATSGVVEVILG